MRRELVLLVVVLSLFAGVSCQKSGVYQPKEKLSAVWYENTKVTDVFTDVDTFKTETKIDKFQREAWTWEEKSLVNRIVYTAVGAVRYNYKYEYKDNKIVGITSALDKKIRIRFVYDDDTRMIKQVRYFTETFSDNELPYKTLNITYDGKKLSSIEEIVNNAKFQLSANECPSLLSCLVSEGMYEAIEQNVVEPKVEYTTTVTVYDFEWDGKNIDKVTVSNDKSEIIANIVYAYDKNKNPQRNRFVGVVEEGSIDYMIFSKNNIVSCSYVSEDLLTSEESEYTYVGKVPETKIVKRVDMAKNYMSETIETFSYEYVED